MRVRPLCCALLLASGCAALHDRPAPVAPLGRRVAASTAAGVGDWTLQYHLPTRVTRVVGTDAASRSRRELTLRASGDGADLGLQWLDRAGDVVRREVWTFTAGGRARRQVPPGRRDVFPECLAGDLAGASAGDGSPAARCLDAARAATVACLEAAAACDGDVCGAPARACVRAVQRSDTVCDGVPLRGP
jgi:hypothetical protein